MKPEEPRRPVRQRMIRSTAELMREQGARATTIDDVLAHADAPRGSVYHHFPGGRKQLLLEATRFAGDHVARLLASNSSAHPLDALDAFILAYREQLHDSDYREGCPIAAVVVEAPPDDDVELLHASGRAMDRWLDILRDHYIEYGIDDLDAEDLALTVISAVEGALIVCRAQQRLDPLAAVHNHLRALIEAALPDGKDTP